MKYQFFMTIMLLLYVGIAHTMSDMKLPKEVGLSAFAEIDLIISTEDGNNILDLSNKQLTNIEGIQNLSVAVIERIHDLQDRSVTYNKKIMALQKVPKLILRLNNNQLNEIPDELSAMNTIIELDLSNNLLKDLPVTMGKMQKLVRLKISHNQLTWLPDSLTTVKSLKQLHADNNALVALPELIGSLGRLEECSFAHNALSSLPSSISSLTRLTKLELQFNALTDSDIALLTSCNQLTQLNLGHNGIMTIPSELSRLLKLRILGLNNNRIANIPADIFILNMSARTGLSNLVSLNLASNILENAGIPEELKDSKLTNCDLSNNKLLITSDLLNKLPKAIISLFLNRNEAINLEGLSKFVKLRVLDLSFCDIADLPVLTLPNLTVLNLSRNWFKIFPSVIFTLKTLETLNISYNELVEIPADIQRLTQLKRLNVSNNQLISLPKELVYDVVRRDEMVRPEDNLSLLHPLESIDISNNISLRALPTNFGELANLKTLIAENTGLVTLPESFGNLRKLEYLNLNFNKYLTRLPYTFISLARYPEYAQGLNHLKQVSLINLPSFTIAIDTSASEQVQKQQKELRHFLLQLIHNKIAIYAPDLLINSLIPEINQAIGSYFPNFHYREPQSSRPKKD